MTVSVLRYQFNFGIKINQTFELTLYIGYLFFRKYILRGEISDENWYTGPIIPQIRDMKYSFISRVFEKASKYNREGL